MLELERNMAEILESCEFSPGLDEWLTNVKRFHETPYEQKTSMTSSAHLDRILEQVRSFSGFVR